MWTAYSRRQARVVAFEIGDTGVMSALALYAKVRRAVGAIGAICTDANRCYELAFANRPELHIISKAETHRIESSNASDPGQSHALPPALQARLQVVADAGRHPRPVLQSPPPAMPKQPNLNSPPRRGGWVPGHRLRADRIAAFDRAGNMIVPLLTLSKRRFHDLRV